MRIEVRHLPKSDNIEIGLKRWFSTRDTKKKGAFWEKIFENKITKVIYQHATVRKLEQKIVQ